MIAPFMAPTLSFGQLRRNAVRVRERLQHIYDYLTTWQAEGHPARIQTRWFAEHRPDGLVAPAKKRRRWILTRNRRRSDFYPQVQPTRFFQGITLKPQSPRWYWTGNTLRSTYEPMTVNGQVATIDSRKLTDRFDAAFYDQHGGPFVDEMLRRGAKPWDLVNLDRSLEDELTRMIADDLVGQFTPRRQGPFAGFPTRGRAA